MVIGIITKSTHLFLVLLSPFPENFTKFCYYLIELFCKQRDNDKLQTSSHQGPAVHIIDVRPGIFKCNINQFDWYFLVHLSGCYTMVIVCPDCFAVTCLPDNFKLLEVFVNSLQSISDFVFGNLILNLS